MPCGWPPGEGQRAQGAQKEPGSPLLEWMSYWQDSGGKKTETELRRKRREERKRRVQVTERARSLNSKRNRMNKS